MPTPGGNNHTATAAIEFGTAGQAATINYNLPLPGAHTGRRIMRLDLGLKPDEFLPLAGTSGEDIKNLVGTTTAGQFVVDHSAASTFFKQRLEDLQVGYATPAVSFEPGVQPDIRHAGNLTAAEAVTSTAAPFLPAVLTNLERLNLQRVDAVSQNFHTSLATTEILVPVLTWGGTIKSVPYYPHQNPAPAFFLVEVWGISSFLGDYGMGRTVKTFTLLPGESTTISMKTWKSSESTIKEASSIVDSHTQEAADRFASTVSAETTDKATTHSKDNWHVDVDVSSSWAVVSGDVHTSAGGEHEAGREEFSRQASSSVAEHTARASAKREISVTASSELTQKTAEEARVERVIKNVNVRRVLNFVFRELNQGYSTKIHLKDIRIVFSNGRLFSQREVPISGLRRLLADLIVPGKVDSTAQAILKLAGTVFDVNDVPVKVLEAFTMSADGTTMTRDPNPALVNGEYPPPTPQRFYRFKRGPLGQALATNPVDGVVLKTNEIVMRTDSVIVEALLGQADALDAYAMEVQETAAHAKALENAREQIVQDTLTGITVPADRAKAFATMLHEEDDDADAA
jgi:hypothetical protein